MTGLLPGLATRRGPSWWARARAARRAKATARAQRRLDARQMARARRERARMQRRDRHARVWAAVRPYILAAAAASTFTAAGSCTGLLLHSATRAAGVGLVAGLLCATVGLLALEWRIHGD